MHLSASTVYVNPSRDCLQCQVPEDGSKATRKNTLVGAALYQRHGFKHGLPPVFPYKFWAFDGLTGRIVV